MELIESRHYFHCRHCGTYHFPRDIDADGIRIVGDGPSGLKCPVCAKVMAHAILDDHHPIDFCATCRGALLARDTFVTVITKRRAWATSPPAEPVPLERQALHRELSCPKCGARVETYPHYGPGNVVIDSCVSCDVIWLDFGEMQRIVDAPGRDRGARLVPTTDDNRPSDSTPEKDEEARPSRQQDPLDFLLDVLWKE